jgi:hypothetical protein
MPSLPIAIRAPWAASALAAGLTLMVYLRTLAPTVFSLDSAELTLAAFSLGLAHSPGYPVYLLLGHLFTYLPFADLGYRLNLLSAVANVGTVALLALLVQRLCGQLLPALVAALSYAFCFYVWSLSVVAEVYTLQGLFLVTILCALCQWHDAGKLGWLYLAAAFVGLATANNPSTVLWWPGLLLLAWRAPQRKQLSAADGWKVVALFLLALTPVLYLPLRSAARPDFVQAGHFDASGRFHALDLTQIDNLFWYLSGRQFAFGLSGYSLAGYAREAMRFGTWLWAAFLGIGLPLGAIGVWTLWQRTRLFAVALLLTALPHALFFIGYGAVDKETMFLPVYLIWAVLLGVGVARVLQALPKQLHLVALLLPASLLLVNLPYADVSDFRGPYELAENRLLEAEEGALYLATWGDAELMRYHQMVLGLRQDVAVVNLFFIAPEDLAGLLAHQFNGSGSNSGSGSGSVYSNTELSIAANELRFEQTTYGYRILPY